MSAAESVVGSVVALAVALSPESHRDVRREQWLADLRDAHELQISRTSLAFGALTTALFHRRAVHRSNWGESMSESSIGVRTAPHTIRTVPVLLATAFLFCAVGVLAGALSERYNGVGSIAEFELLRYGTVAAMSLLPALSVAGAVLVLDGVPRVRRLVGALVVLGLGGAYWGVLVGVVPTVPYWSQTASVGALLLATWLWVRHRRGYAWVVIVAPFIVAAVLSPIEQVVPGIGTPTFSAGVGWLVQLMPFAVLPLAGWIAARLSTPAPPTEPSTVDAGPGQGGTGALVDKRS